MRRETKEEVDWLLEMENLGLKNEVFDGTLAKKVKGLEYLDKNSEIKRKRRKKIFAYIQFGVAFMLWFVTAIFVCAFLYLKLCGVVFIQDLFAWSLIMLVWALFAEWVDTTINRTQMYCLLVESEVCKIKLNLADKAKNSRKNLSTTHPHKGSGLVKGNSYKPHS